jgi:hypothetical protein
MARSLRKSTWRMNISSSNKVTCICFKGNALRFLTLKEMLNSSIACHRGGKTTIGALSRRYY